MSLIILAAFLVGVLFGWILHEHYGPKAPADMEPLELPPPSIHQMAVMGLYRDGVIPLTSEQMRDTILQEELDGLL